jgi:hypothetical protein
MEVGCNENKFVIRGRDSRHRIIDSRLMRAERGGAFESSRLVCRAGCVAERRGCQTSAASSSEYNSGITAGFSARAFTSADRGTSTFNTAVRRLLSMIFKGFERSDLSRGGRVIQATEKRTDSGPIAGIFLFIRYALGRDRDSCKDDHLRFRMFF